MERTVNTISTLHPSLRYLGNHPFSDWEGAIFEGWALFELTIITPVQDGEAHELLLRLEWNHEHITEWFLENYHALKYEEAPAKVPADQSLTAWLNATLFQPDVPDVVLDEDKDNPYAQDHYRRRHDMGLAIAGMTIPAIMLGKRGPFAEISMDLDNHPSRNSYYSHNQIDDSADDVDIAPPRAYKDICKEGTWAYRFDMDEFVDRMLEQVGQFLYAWFRDVTLPEVRAISAPLLARWGELSGQEVQWE
jgi:hypothetical protein